MRKSLVLLIAVVAALVSAAAASATVVHVNGIETSVPATFHSYWSEACGFDIYSQFRSVQDTTLVLNKDGVVVSQIDIVSDAVFTLTAPSHETELALPASLAVHYTYPEGATLGAPVGVAITGFQAKYPGLAADAGRQLYTSHVTGFVGQVPQWEGIWGGAVWIDRIGHWNDPSVIDRVICAILGGT